MEIKEAIIAFSQSDKIKSSIIWASQAVEMTGGLSEEEKPGAIKIIRAVIGMIGNEILLCKKSAPHALWADVQKNIDTAMVMIDSNVVDSGYKPPVFWLIDEDCVTPFLSLFLFNFIEKRVEGPHPLRLEKFQHVKEC